MNCKTNASAPSGSSDIVSKTITANGTYNATDEGHDGYNPVTVNISSGESGGYIRPTGAPDMNAIIAAAPLIEDGGTTYAPIYGIAAMDTVGSATFQKTGTGISTGADAYVFSDDLGTIHVGTSVAHAFDPADDFATSQSWKARYVIMYATAANKANVNGITVNLYNYRATYEFVAAAGTIFSNQSAISGYSSSATNRNLRYLDLTNATIYNNNISVSYFCASSAGLIEVKFPNTLTKIEGISVCKNSGSLTSVNLPSLTTISGYSAFEGCSSLSSFTAPNLTTISGDTAFDSCSSLSPFTAPELTTITGNLMFRYCYNLKSISLLSVTSWTSTSTSTLNYTSYIELPENFNINAVNLTGAIGYSKSWEWLNVELPAKLKDNSGGTAKTMTLGAANIALIGATAAATIAAKNWTIA